MAERGKIQSQSYYCPIAVRNPYLLFISSDAVSWHLLPQGQNLTCWEYSNTQWNLIVGRLIYLLWCLDVFFLYRSHRNGNAGFQQVLERLESDPVCQRLSLKSFLILPFQRITRLKLLLQVTVAILCFPTVSLKMTLLQVWKSYKYELAPSTGCKDCIQHFMLHLWQVWQDTLKPLCCVYCEYAFAKTNLFVIIFMPAVH